MTGKIFNILTNIALCAGKKAQSETSISYGGSSVSWAAVAKAQQVLGTLKDKAVLLIGAGKMGKITAQQLKNKEVAAVYAMNRTLSKAEALVEELNGKPVSFWELKEVLEIVDVCVCSAGAPHYIVERAAVEKVMEKRSGKKLLFIDISIPRNIDPAVASLNGVELISLDDLGNIVGDNLKIRECAVSDVEKIISAKLELFYERLRKIEIFAKIREAVSPA